MRSVRPKKTVDDYLRLPDDVRVELFDGEFFVTPAPQFPHQDTILRLGGLLQSFVHSRKLGEIVIAPFDCVLSPEVVVQPDLLNVRADRVPGLKVRLNGPPDVAIEVLSPGHAERDRIIKRDLYAEYGVPEFWIIDPDAKTVEVMRLETGAFRLLGMFDGEEEIVSPTFQGLSLRVDQLFE